ncbi:MAG: VTT domain-containing protein [Velocimicrobium sp.]
MEKQTRRRVIAYCILFLFLIFVVTIILLPYFQRLSEPAYQAQIQRWVNKMGIVGMFALLGGQVLQIIIAFIPGEPVEMLSGALYGAVGGLTICLAGCIMASTIIFTLTKKFGKRLLYLLFSEDKIQTWRWLHESQKNDMVIFILFFIPGTPKDMLTYIVGMTEMSTGKFIGISMLARIPSVLSSTMIGATMRQGEWKMSLIVFFITGIVGVFGIGFKNKIINFCHKIMKRGYQDNTRCECLDFVEAAYRNRVYPVMYCRMQIEGPLDGDRLKNAVNVSSQYVPEVLYTYDSRHDCFVNKGLCSDCAIVITKQNIEFDFWWDLSKDTQIKIFICQEELKTTITFGMSHILTDGEGFLQYLYLLSSLYNEKYPNSQIQNSRKISTILKDIHVKSPTEQTKNGKKFVMSPLLHDSKGTQYFCLNSIIAEAELKAIHTKAKNYGATLNDVFMAAYVYVIAQLQNTDKVIIPCPANLRKFKPPLDSLTIANMTGNYRMIVVEITPQHTFNSILAQIHIEMELQKSHYRCFAGICILDFVYHKVPRSILNFVIKRGYRLLPVTYTNVGVIDRNRLYFKDSNITYCYLTGTYRFPPDFQLSISTFKNVCTLNCTLIGDTETKTKGFQILEQVKSELLRWVQE